MSGALSTGVCPTTLSFPSASISLYYHRTTKTDLNQVFSKYTSFCIHHSMWTSMIQQAFRRFMPQQSKEAAKYHHVKTWPVLFSLVELHNINTQTTACLAHLLRPSIWHLLLVKIIVQTNGGPSKWKVISGVEPMTFGLWGESAMVYSSNGGLRVLSQTEMEHNKAFPRFHGGAITVKQGLTLERWVWKNKSLTRLRVSNSPIKCLSRGLPSPQPPRLWALSQSWSLRPKPRRAHVKDHMTLESPASDRKDRGWVRPHSGTSQA